MEWEHRIGRYSASLLTEKLWAEKSWVLLRDNAPAHRSIAVTGFLARTAVWPHSPYSLISPTATSANTIWSKVSRHPLKMGPG
ncbi:hypothetical protein TNCV_869751 [Trichonephila clavipes]|nr:hypothetical protein TNCV_869751 [Trichonephila clavipes]